LYVTKNADIIKKIIGKFFFRMAFLYDTTTDKVSTGSMEGYFRVYTYSDANWQPEDRIIRLISDVAYGSINTILPGWRKMLSGLFQ